MPAENDVFGTPMAKDFEAMRQKFVELGFYDSDMKDEVFKLFITLGPGVLGARLLHSGMPCLGAFLIAFSFYLCGWTAHDYLHHGVLKGNQRRLVLMNNIMGFFLGMWQGFAPAWWRARHNTHHCVTNERGNDPDIKTAPALTFVRNSAAMAKSLNAVQRWQQYYYVPLMALLDVYWRLESLQYLSVRKLKDTWLEWSMMIMHYAVLFWVFDGQYSWMLFTSLVRGFLTGIVVFATHYGEEHLEGGNHKMTLVEQTALTSRNITGGYIVNLLTGYISLQTEHHLFPMMPTGKRGICCPSGRRAQLHPHMAAPSACTVSSFATDPVPLPTTPCSPSRQGAALLPRVLQKVGIAVPGVQFGGVREVQHRRARVCAPSQGGLRGPLPIRLSGSIRVALALPLPLLPLPTRSCFPADPSELRCGRLPRWEEVKAGSKGVEGMVVGLEPR